MLAFFLSCQKIWVLFHGAGSGGGRGAMDPEMQAEKGVSRKKL